MTKETHEIAVDTKTGMITINGQTYPANELTHEVEYPDNVQVLTVRASNGDVYRFETQKRSFLGGYGTIGSIISRFLIDYPHAKVVSEAAVERQKRAATASKAAEIREKQREAIMSGDIPRIDPPEGLLLKKDEYTIFTNTGVRYCQEKTKTTYYGGSARVRICKGVSIGGGKGVPVKEEFIATLDTGRLTLTNKRLIFSGERKSTTINLPKLAAIERYTDAVDLTKENAVKKSMFVGIDGNLYADVIERIVEES